MLKMACSLTDVSDADHVRGREMRTWFQNGKDGRENSGRNSGEL
jgi:hypothetical protein